MNVKSSGAFSVAFAYVCWGLLTLYWNLLSEVNSIYILSQRVIWSAVFMALILFFTGRLKEAGKVFKNPKMLLKCFLCGALVTLNWGIYIFSVTSGHVLDASLGYFMEPIAVAVIGMLIFKEALSKFEKLTFILAAAALVYLIFATGTFPVLAVGIALTFSIYGALKKELSLDPSVSLFMETLCITPIAVIFALFAEKHGFGATGIISGWKLALLPLCGIVTSVPLLLFNIGVKKIPYYVTGILMYISPSLQFFTGLVCLKEPINANQLIAFIIIWIGISFTVFEQAAMLKKHNS